MAKKKKKPARKKTPSSRASKKGSKKASTKKSAPKKASAKQGGKSSSANQRGNSVDSVLRKFQKDRSTQETQLASLRKKIEDLEAKVLAYRGQVAKLVEQENALKQGIAQLDSRRDQEVTALLAKLGVKLAPGSSAARPSSSAENPGQQKVPAPASSGPSGRA